jgi:uncharacterized membrane protein YkvA (DUF1232 family)
LAAFLGRWRARARELKIQVHALGLACRDPRTPWYAKAFAALVAAYALSPIDLIPDFIPVLGQLDDLLLVPLGVAVAVLLVVGVWLALLALVAWLVLRPLLRQE